MRQALVAGPSSSSSSSSSSSGSSSSSSRRRTDVHRVSLGLRRRSALPCMWQLRAERAAWQPLAALSGQAMGGDEVLRLVPLEDSSAEASSEGTSVPLAEAAEPEEAGRPAVRIIGTYVEEGAGVAGEAREELASQAPGVLKINVDLQLYRVRTLRHDAFYVRDKSRRAKMLRGVEKGFRAAIALDPTDGRAYVGLGKHYMQQRRLDDAYRVYEEGCTATQGQNQFIWQAWATLEARRGNVNKARKFYDAAIVACESHVTAWHGWGQLEMKQGNSAKARELWVKGLQKAKAPNAYLYQSLGVLADKLGNIEEARSWFRRGTEKLKDKSAHAIWQAWAKMEIEHGDPATVRFLFRKGLDANPKSRYIHLTWGSWEMDQGDTTRARAILRAGNEVNPMDPAIYQALGVLEQRQGNLDLARSYFEEGIKVDKSHIWLWQAWGVLEWRNGNLDEARSLFQRGIWANPKSKNVCAVFQSWGCVERDAGNTKVALNLFMCAVKADPSSTVSWLAWSQLEESLGRYNRANDIRNFSMQERVEVVTPQLTSADLQVGWEAGDNAAGAGPSSLQQAVQEIGRWLQAVTPKGGKTKP